MSFILPYKGVMPTIAKNAYIAPNATIIGNVTIGAESSVWFGTVIRGDVMPITIGERTNIQDNSVIHVTRVTGPTHIGSGVTLGHAVMLHGCTVEDHSFIGMRAVLLDDSVVKQGAMLAAGAVLTPRKTVPSGAIWAGSPAAYMRDMSQKERDFIPESADNYIRLAQEYQAEPI